MLALLKKDYLVNRFIYFTLTLILAIVVILLSLKTTEGSIVISVMSTVFIPLIVNRFGATEEMRKNYDLIINSFPVKRRDVVISKFLYYIIAYVIATAIFMSITVIFNKLKGFDFHMLLLVESLIFVYYCFFIGLPNFIYYYFDYEISIKYSGAITLSVLYVPPFLIGILLKFNPALKNQLKEILFSSMNGTNIIPFIIILIGIVIYFIFMVLSILGYEKKDLI